MKYSNAKTKRGKVNLCVRNQQRNTLYCAVWGCSKVRMGVVGGPLRHRAASWFLGRCRVSFSIGINTFVLYSRVWLICTGEQSKKIEDTTGQLKNVWLWYKVENEQRRLRAERGESEGHSAGMKNEALFIWLQKWMQIFRSGIKGDSGKRAELGCGKGVSVGVEEDKGTQEKVCQK